MEFIYPFIISFMIVFFSELGDKTQLLVMSFSSKSRAKNVLLGVAIGTFFSHGIAILFGSNIASFSNGIFDFYLKIFTYISFLLFGILGFVPKKEKAHSLDTKTSFLKKITNLKFNYVFIVAISIVVGELGDKTFLASLGLGLEYPRFKLSLIFGSILGMVFSNSLAIFFGKLLGKHLKKGIIEFFSNIIFIVFGLIGLICLMIC